MSLTPRRITDPEISTRPLKTWLAGLALAMLGLGAYGAWQPLMPADTTVFAPVSDDVAVMDFSPAEQTQSDEPETEEEQEPEVEIPPVPEITPPLTPPEVPDLVPLETPPPPPVAAPKPKPAEPRPAAKPKSTGRSSSNGTSSTPSPTLFTGGGTGRFPSPVYPATARSAKQQGTVRLLVTVEASGLPSSVEVQASSGFGVLDSVARDHLSRRWRWPAGPVRRFLVPIRFVLQ